MPIITLANDSGAFDCADDDTVLRAALRAGIGMSYSCNVGSCGNCRFELIEGEVRHLRADSPAWTDKDRKRNRWLGCQARPSGPCTVKFRADPAAVPAHPPLRRKAVFVEQIDLNHDMAEFAFRVDGDATFLPGQYALFSIEGVEGARVYSMCNLPDDNIWRFMIKRVPGGAATTALFDQLRQGDSIGLDGPYGLAFLREDSPRPLVLLAGGSGLSPMVSIARAALASPAMAGRAVHFFFGGRTPRDLEPGAVIAALDAPNLHYTAAISEPGQADGWGGSVGFIHDVADGMLGDALRDAEIYFAGPSVMATAVQVALHARGVPAAQIHFDEFY